MYRFLLLCLVGALVWPTFTNAQFTDDALQTTPRRRPSRGMAYLRDTLDIRFLRHEVAINPVGPFQGLEAPMLFYRLNWKNIGFRTGLNFGIQPLERYTYKVDGRSTPLNRRLQQYGVSAMLGVQYHRLWGRFQLNTGLDMIGGYGLIRDYIREEQAPVDPYVSNERTRLPFVVIAPFFGGRFFLTPRFSLGVEMTLNAVWFQELRNIAIERGNPIFVEENRARDEGWRVGFNLSNIRFFVSYYLPQKGMLKKR